MQLFSMLRMAWLVYGAGCVAVLILLLQRNSQDPLIFGYSARFLFLWTLIGMLMAAVPGLYWALQKFGGKKLLFLLVPATTLGAVMYFAASSYFYHTRIVPFDPFLQIAPPRFPHTERPAGPGYRILTLGGSTTAFSAYPETLRRILAARYPDVNIEVFNCGQAQWSTKHSLINYVTYGRKLEADLVIIMHAINDLTRSCEPYDLSFGPYNDDWSHFYAAAIHAVRPLTFELHLARYYFGGIYDFYDDREVDSPLTRFRSIGPYREHLAALLEYAKADGTDAALITQPSLFHEDLTEAEREALNFAQVFCKVQTGFMAREWPSPCSMARAMRAFNGAVRDLAVEKDVLLVDAEAKIEKTLANFFDDVHTKQETDAEIGRLVASAIAGSGMVESRLGQYSSGTTPGSAEF